MEEANLNYRIGRAGTKKGGGSRERIIFAGRRKFAWNQPLLEKKGQRKEATE